MLGGCRTGDAKITAGYCLPARHVIHAVGPRWQGGERAGEVSIHAPGGSDLPRGSRRECRLPESLATS